MMESLGTQFPGSNHLCERAARLHGSCFWFTCECLLSNLEDFVSCSMKVFISKLGTKFVFLNVHDRRCLFADAVLPSAGSIFFTVFMAFKFLVRHL